MKREESNERKLRVQQLFEKWCKANNRHPDSDSFIAYDATQGKRLLDHQKAMDEGYYSHLRMQAAAIIASWARVEPMKTSGGKSVVVKPTYVVNGITKWTKDILTSESDLKTLIADFEEEVQNKTLRLYLLAERRDALSAKARRSVQQALANAEEAAFKQALPKSSAA